MKSALIFACLATLIPVHFALQPCGAGACQDNERCIGGGCKIPCGISLCEPSTDQCSPQGFCEKKAVFSALASGGNPKCGANTCQNGGNCQNGKCFLSCGISMCDLSTNKCTDYAFYKTKCPKVTKPVAPNRHPPCMVGEEKDSNGCTTYKIHCALSG